MKPISAVAVAAWLFVFGATSAGWISASPHFYGVMGIIVAAIVLLDTFWLGALAWPRRNREAP